MDPVRPTIRCLRDDLKLPLLPITTPLDEINHPLIAKAHEQFATSGTRHERIAAIDDTVLFKVKILTKVILDIMPGCEPGGWYPEARLPDRLLGPNEQAWSNIMDTAAAAKLLEAD